jgi:hypothetical protein
MNAIITTLLLATSLLLLSDSSYAQGWRGIVPLHSTRSDVERLLGPPKESRGAFSAYKTKDEEVRVSYSIASCKTDKSANWNVPLGTVIQFTVHPNEHMLVKSLKLDKTKYERELDYHSRNIIYHFNREEGIHISARFFEGEDEFVDSITYWPRAADEHLRCPKPTRKKRT